MSIKKGLGLIAVLYFTSSFQAQVKSDSAAVQEKKIDEVVLIGYGTVKKKNATSAIENVKADVFENRPIYNVTQALQGTAAGAGARQTMRLSCRRRPIIWRRGYVRWSLPKCRSVLMLHKTLSVPVHWINPEERSCHVISPFLDVTARCSGVFAVCPCRQRAVCCRR